MLARKSESLIMNSISKIESLVGQLQSKKWVERQRARIALEKIGRRATPRLIELLSSRNKHLRWEACKALGHIEDPAAAASLVAALTDDSMEVRWLAAEGLIALEDRALIPLLQALEVDFESPFLRQGAHHVLHALERKRRLNEKTLAVLDTIRFLEPKLEVAVAARKALDSLGRMQR
jgi:HEAT repeat protein